MAAVEYQIVSFTLSQCTEAESVLDDMAEAGWRLVSTAAAAQQYWSYEHDRSESEIVVVYTMERPKGD